MAPIQNQSRERGSMLIVATGVLALLLVMSITFVTLMRYEKLASTNYVDGTKAKLAAESGLNRFIADLGTIAKEPAYDGVAPGGRLRSFVFGVMRTGPAAGKEIDVAKRVEEIDPIRPEDAYFYGKVGASYVKGADEYRIKVVDTSALFDLNFPMEMDTSGATTGGSTGTGLPKKGQMLELMLETLGREIRAERQRMNRPPAWNPVAGANDTDVDPVSRRKPIQFAGFVGAQAILAYRATLDGRRFSSKSQLQEIMEEESYRLLSDYVTAHGSADDFSIQAAATLGTGGHSNAKRTDGTIAYVNLNLAPRPVLVAMLAPLAGRRFVYHIVKTSQSMEEGTSARPNYEKGAATEASFVTSQKEDKAYDVREGYIYVGPFGDARAQQVANWIIRERPFLGYGDLHGRLKAEMLRGAQSELASALPPATVLGTGTPISEPGVRYFPPQNPQDVRFNITGIEAQPYFGQLVREAGISLLLAALNPAATMNSHVPNTASILPVDKGSLLYPTAENVQQNREGGIEPRQTFNACFDTRGVFEVTSLGQLKKAGGELVAQEKILTVVKLLGHVTHRTQSDFEKYDQMFGGPGATGNPRVSNATWPNRRQNFADLTAPVDEPSDLASEVWGHVEIATRSVFEDQPNQAQSRFPSFARAGMGTPIFGALFEWFQKGEGLEQARAFHALLANRGTFYTNPGEPAGLTYNEARGSLFPYPGAPYGGGAGGPMPLIVTRPGGFRQGDGSGGILYNDGVHLSYRFDRDHTLWYRAGANEDDTRRQGALPLQTDPNYKGAPDQQTQGSHKEGNVWYRKGGVEFWYKPEFDWGYFEPGATVPKPFPLYCGYFSASRVYYNPGVKVQQYGNLVVDASIVGPDGPGGRGLPTDATQIYLFRNTEGQLRATRLYARVVGQPDTRAVTHLQSKELPCRFLDPKEGDTYGEATHPDYANGKSFVAGKLEPTVTDEGGAIEVYRRGVERVPIDVTQPDQPRGYPWPPLEFAEKTGSSTEPYTLNEKYIKNARVDAYVPFERMASWKAGEWHHIGVYWDDGADGNPHSFLRIYVDGRKQSEAKVIGEAKNMFCRLNEPPRVWEDDAGRFVSAENGSNDQERRYPRDRITVGCIERRIAKPDEGVFKHRNTVSAGATAAPANDPTRILLYACGVVDDFVIYDGEQVPGDTFPEVPRRFEPESTYVQRFDLASRMPGGGRPLEVARLSWTCLLPSEAHGTNPLTPGTGIATIEVTEPATVKTRDPGAQGAGQGPIVYQQMRSKHSFAKLEEQGKTTPGLVPAATPWLRYEFTLKAASYGPGSFNVGQLPQIDTPALQEVSLSYFLPSPATLLKERVVD